MNTKTNLKILTTILLLSFVCNTSKAMFAIPGAVPVDRLIANATAYIEENPTDANGYYILGRINYLAFANNILEIPAFDRGVNVLPEMPYNYQYENSGLTKGVIYISAYDLALEELGYIKNSMSIFLESTMPEVPTDKKEKFLEVYEKKIKELNEQKMKYRSRSIKNKPDPNEIFQHVNEAVKNFQKAIDMNPNNGLYSLSLASLMEQYVNHVKDINIKEVPEELRNIILDKARDTYLRAYELSIEIDLNPEYELPPVGFFASVSYEAGSAYIRIVETQKSITDMQRTKAAEIHKNISKGLSSRMGLITPIVFSFEKLLSPTDLLERDFQVNFDLNGDGTSELWPWVKPSTGILVWNEDGKGEITSGRQMFGSVTWWLFFNDGYHALDCLDDNRDSVLSGNELKGISVWFDTNSNGKSESGEIKSLEELGIISISTKSTSTENGWPANKTGITLKTGQIIPTYDWIAKPISNKSNI